MTEPSTLLQHFEHQRPRLRSIAYRLLGSASDADDAVQETWLRLSRSETSAVDNLGGWLTTVVSNVCLDMLRTRKARAEAAGRPEVQPPAAPRIAARAEHPEEDLILAESVSAALLVVLQRLSPAERVAFVLHDLFDLNFEEIAPILERTPEATRQLASRARRRVRGGDTLSESQQSDRQRQHQITSEFLHASKTGNLEGLVALLDPDVVFRGDATAVRMGGPAELRGAAAVAATFKGRAQAALPILVDGHAGVLVAPRGHLRLVLRLSFRDGRISEIETIADPARLAQVELGVLS
jgi:RNA polymerase sigma factor (sigma-70 family)